MPLCPIIIFLYTKNWQHSLKCLVEFPGMFEDMFPRMFGDIPRNVWGYSLECLATFPGMFSNIPRTGMFSNIHRKVWRHSPEYNIPPFPAFPAFRSPFLHSWFYTYPLRLYVTCQFLYCIAYDIIRSFL